MSTFSGYLPEFPQIRIDNFRPQPGRSPPLACFLSHVHSDHLVGLETLKGPFVYCSSATREILLRLEKWPHRMNFQKGILEVRRQTYRHLAKILKPLPLGRPVTLELSPGNSIRVTLFDANHCAGAVMFLIEDVSTQTTVLYTGDIRAEQWWIDSLVQHPLLLPYTQAAGLRRLDNIYLDTTFAVKTSSYRRFPTKAEGIAELLRKVAQYPEQTAFYMRAWTFGYEDVWLALSSALGSPVHLDRYRYRLYTSVGKTRELGPGLECKEASVLCGFQVANDVHQGILTRDPSVRLHSCERGSGCPVLLDLARGGRQVVDICPIISRHKGHEMHELGAGGGSGDLDRSHELDLADPAMVRQLIDLLKQSVKDGELLEKIQTLLQRGVQSQEKRLDLFVNDTNSDAVLMDEVSLPKVVEFLRKMATEQDASENTNKPRSKTTLQRITFPYSRHSSYEELRSFVAAFQPRDVFPCVAPTVGQWNENMSIEVLFGDLCTPHEEGFVWDVWMRAARERRDAAAGAEERASPAGTSSPLSENSEEHEMALSGALNAAAPPVEASVDSDTESEMDEALTAELGGLSEEGARRLRVRKAAFAAAASGNWATIALSSVKRKLVDFEEEL